MARPSSLLYKGTILTALQPRSPGHEDETFLHRDHTLAYQDLEKGGVIESQAQIPESLGQLDVENSNAHSQDADIDELDTQEPNTHEPNTQEPDTQEPDIQEPEIQEPETQNPQIQAQGTEEEETALHLVSSSQQTQRPANDAHFATLPNNTKRRKHKHVLGGIFNGDQRIRDTSTIRSDAEKSHENNAVVSADSIPEQIRFFDVQFDNVSKEYIVTSLQEGVQDWYNLKLESTCTAQDEIFRRGDLVHIKLHDHANVRPGDDVARIEDIRALSSTDKRRLVLIAWLYSPDGRFYESNHLQIVLWDTITRRPTQSLAKQVHRRQLYNVCGGRKFCSEKQAEVWRERKAHMLEGTGG